MQNAITCKAFGSLAKNDSGVLNEFEACMYGYEDESKFHEAWYAFLYKYKFDGNTWAESIFKEKEQFAHCSMKKACTQVSECFNSHLKEYMRY